MNNNSLEATYFALVDYEGATRDSYRNESEAIEGLRLAATDEPNVWFLITYTNDGTHLKTLMLEDINND